LDNKVTDITDAQS